MHGRVKSKEGQIVFHFHEMREMMLKKLTEHLPRNLLYHNVQHTQNVEKVAAELAKLEGLNTKEIKLIRTAALYHDCGFIYQHHENESFAVDIAEKELPRFNYSQQEIQMICSMIHSTQSNSHMQNLYDEILSDADHDYFGRDDYFKIALDLRKELQLYGRTFAEEDWLVFQLNYLVDKHSFKTNSAIRLRQEGKERNIEQLKKQLTALHT